MDPTVNSTDNAKSNGPENPTPHPNTTTTTTTSPPPPPTSASEIVAADAVAPASDVEAPVAATPASDPSLPSDRGAAGPKTVTWSRDLTSESAPPPPAAAFETEANAGANLYVTHSATQSSSSQSTMETVKEALDKWGRTVSQTTSMFGNLGRDTWQHFKTGPSFTESAMGRLAQGTKVLAEGGYEKIFRQTFETLPEEKLRISYACYLSTSAGPVMGIMYLSTHKIAFCSDNPLPYKDGNKTEWSYYKVVIPLNQLRVANPSVSKVNSAEKYIQIVSVDNHEFWFMGFLRYDSAVTSLQEALAYARDSQP